MNSLKFIDDEIFATKCEITITNIELERTDTIIRKSLDKLNRLNKKLQTLQQIKDELEAWEIVKKDFILTWEEPNNASGYYLNYFSDCEYEKIKKALEVEE